MGGVFYRLTLNPDMHQTFPVCTASKGILVYLSNPFRPKKYKTANAHIALDMLCPVLLMKPNNMSLLQREKHTNAPWMPLTFKKTELICYIVTASHLWSPPAFDYMHISIMIADSIMVRQDAILLENVAQCTLPGQPLVSYDVHEFINTMNFSFGETRFCPSLPFFCPLPHPIFNSHCFCFVTSLADNIQLTWEPLVWWQLNSLHNKQQFSR